MLSYIEYLKTPAGIATALVCIFFAMQIVGEILEFKGKVVPEFVKIRKYFARKKKERDIIAQTPALLEKVEGLLSDVKKHYDKDNIAKRDKWIAWVNNQATVYDNGMAALEKKMSDLDEKLDKNNDITLSLLIENKRNTIIDFASKVIDDSYPATREQFNRIFKIHSEYEEIIDKYEMTNGEVDIAVHIIKEAYEEHMRHHTFIEDVRGYNK